MVEGPGDFNLYESADKNVEEHEQQETDFGGITNNPDDFMPNIPIEVITYPDLKNFKKEARIELKESYLTKLTNYLQTKYNFNIKFIDIFVNDDGHVFIKAKRSNDWSQITDNSKEKITDRQFIDVDDLKIIKSNDGRSNKTKNQNLISIITDPNYRIEKIIDKTHPVSEKEIEDIKNTHKIMTDAGTDPANLQDLTGNIVIKNPEIARILLRLGQLVEEYQGLLNEERKTNPENTQRLKELEEMMNDIENRVISIVNQELAREIDIALDVPLLTRIRNIFQREGLTIAAIADALGTIISTIFAIVFGVSNATKSIVPGPSPGPQPQPTPTPGPTPDPTIPDKIKNFIINAFKKVAEILKKIAAWAAATLPGLIGSIVAWLFDKAATMVTFLAEHVFIVIMLLLGFSFRVIIDYLEKKSRK